MVWAAALLFFAAFYTLLIPLPLALTSLGLPGSQVGAILGAFGVASLLGRPLAGALGDLLGLRWMMLAGALLFVAGALGFGQTTWPLALFGMRILQALGYVAFTTAATTLVADLAPVERRGALIALFGVAANLAMTLTPASISAVLPALGLSGAFWLAAGLALLAAGLALALRAPQAAARAHDRRGVRSILGALRPPATLAGPMTLALLLGVGFGAFLQFLPLLSEQRGLAAGWAYSAYGVAIIATRLVSGRSIDGASRTRLLALGFGALACGLGTLALATAMPALLLGTVLVAAGSGIAHPILITVHTERASDGARAQATAGFYLAFDLGIGAGAWVLGLVLERYGLAALFAVAALAALGALAAARRLLRPPRAWAQPYPAHNR
jgi:predicted MFS family arabinose efflux permease